VKNARIRHVIIDCQRPLHLFYTNQSLWFYVFLLFLQRLNVNNQQERRVPEHDKRMDIELSLKKLRSGDEAELERFYKLWFPPFLSFALGFLPGEDDVCRDIVQDVFIAYWQRRQDFSDAVSLKVFFYRSLRNRCLNELRSRQVRTLAEKEVLERLSSTVTLEDSVVREEVSMAVRCSVESLPPQSRRILLMALAGKSNREIALKLSLSLNTVKTHKQRAYQTLRTMLKDVHTLLAILAV